MDGRGDQLRLQNKLATVKTIHGSCALGSGGCFFFLKRRILFSYNFYVLLVLLLYCVLGLNG